jgi:hypothetical protein
VSDTTSSTLLYDVELLDVIIGVSTPRSLQLLFDVTPKQDRI